MFYDVIIIGAGASGLFCASAFTERVFGLVIEHTNQIGTKLKMSGAGKCNITHGGNIKEFPLFYGDNGKKVRGCLYKYNNEKLTRHMKSIGVSLFEREDGKVFPRSLKSTDVVDALVSKAKERGFEFKVSTNVVSIDDSMDHIRVITDTGVYECGNLVIACGGRSYPRSGSDGSMVEILQRDLDINIIPQKPALVPFTFQNYTYGNLSGVSLQKANVSIWREWRKVAQLTAPILFADSYLSGPAILNISRYGQAGDMLYVNYLPDFNTKEVATILQGFGKKSLENFILAKFNLPHSLVKCLLGRCSNTSGTLDVAKVLTSDEFQISGSLGFKRAMVTAGGISLKEIKSTMELRKHPRIYAIGEVLDVDGDTGGYNLQFAFSSGLAAAGNIEKEGLT